MTEAHEYPGVENPSHPDLAVVSGERIESLETNDSLMSPAALNYVASSLGMRLQEVEWLRREDAAAIVALFDTIISKFAGSDELHAREVMRLSLFLGEAASDETISEQVSIQFDARMAIEDVVLEREDLQELVQRGLKKRGAKTIVRRAIATLRQEMEASVLAEVIPIVEDTITEEDEEPVLLIAGAGMTGKPVPATRKATRSKPVLRTVTAEDAENDKGDPVKDESDGQQGSIDRDPVGQYLDEIARVPLLSAEEEVQLSKIIEAGLFAEKLLEARENGGSDDADITPALLQKHAKTTDDELAFIMHEGQRGYQHFIKANLRLVVSIARKYNRNGVPLLDNIQGGNIGLLRAVEKFDYTKGFKFSTYGTWWVRQSITRAAADSSRTIRLPVHMTELVNKMTRVMRQMTDNLGREPTDEELAKELSIDVEKLKRVRDDSRPVNSIDAPLSEGSETRLGDIIVTSSGADEERCVDEQMIRVQLLDIMRALLSEREYDVMTMRFGFTGDKPATLDEIAPRWGVTRERIRQIERDAMQKLLANVTVRNLYSSMVGQSA